MNFRILLSIVALLVIQTAALARNVYGYIGFYPGIAPIVPCTVTLSGGGIYRQTRAYYHPFGIFKMRYYFNGLPTNQSYTVKVIPDAWYGSAITAFSLPGGWTDYKIPDVWVRM